MMVQCWQVANFVTAADDDEQSNQEDSFGQVTWKSSFKITMVFKEIVQEQNSQQRTFGLMTRLKNIYKSRDYMFFHSRNMSATGTINSCAGNGIYLQDRMRSKTSRNIGMQYAVLPKIMT
jgi:hypothetical protein